MTERRIGDDGDVVFGAPRNHRMLDRALLQMVKNLVAGDFSFARDLKEFIQIVGI